MKSKTLSLKTIIKELDFLRKTVIIQWNAWKKKGPPFLASKLIEKIPDPCNAKKHCQWVIRKEKNKTKPVKQQKIITYQQKAFENPYIVDIKSVIIEHAKTLHKLSKTIK